MVQSPDKKFFYVCRQHKEKWDLMNMMIIQTRHLNMGHEKNLPYFLLNLLQKNPIHSPEDGLDKHTDRDQRSWISQNYPKKILCP